MKLLKAGRLAFSPVLQDITEEEVKKAMLELDEAYMESSLPDQPDEEAFRSYLYNLRLRDLAFSDVVS